MKGWLARWDVTPGEQAGMTFAQVLTVVNLRRVEIMCLLGLLTRGVEIGVGFRGPAIAFELPVISVILLASLAIRRRGADSRLARVFVAIVLVMALLETQWLVAALGAQGRLTSAYPLMLLSLALLFVVPPRLVALGLMTLFVSYCAIVLDTATRPAEKVVAIVNTAIVSVIAIVAAALIYAGRRRDHAQRQEIRLRNEQLIERSAELDTLMAITAHDLRSPLYGLRNLFDLATRRASQEPDLPLVVIGQAKASIDAMLVLATRLLDAHAAEHRLPTCLVDDDVRTHVLAAVARVGPLAQSADVRIAVDLPDRPLVASLDPRALAQILDNLLSNGVRFSPAGGVLTIAATPDACHVAISVRDEGPGVDPAMDGLLFRKFGRGASGPSADIPGIGMGLFIVATLARQTGASVRHEPAAGGGAVFIVDVPRRMDGLAGPST